MPPTATPSLHNGSRLTHRPFYGTGNLAIQQRMQSISQAHDPQERSARQRADLALRDANPRAGLLRKGQTVQATSHPGGQPLPHSQRRYFEARFGQDFSAVRIHDDSNAHQSAAAINARAFTLGNHISFDQGQYAPHTAPGRRLLAHELAHVSQPDSDPNTAYRESWDVDDSARTIERGLLVQLIFKNTWSDWYNNTGWTSARKNTFRTNFAQNIESSFNNSGMVIKPHPAMADVLPADNISKGYDPKVDISLVPDGDTSVSEDWEVDVYSNPSGSMEQSSSGTSYGTLDEADNTAVAKPSSAPGVTQIPTVHEFGHFIGLDHPGEGLEGGWFSDSRLSPGANEYGHTGTDQHGRTVDGPNDLMGSGMGMQPFYFDAWAQQLNEHVEALRSAAARRRFNAEMRTFKKAMRGDPASAEWFMRGLSGSY